VKETYCKPTGCTTAAQPSDKYCVNKIDKIMEEEMDNQPKRLYRSNKNRMLGGVCGGLAEYMNIDPTIIRLVAVVGFFATASAFFWAYLIMWIVVPDQPTTIL